MRLTQEEGVVVGGRPVVPYDENLVVQWVGGWGGVRMFKVTQ